ncbi:MAG: hypothetical protein CVU51_10000 [Deltaproteobacteria bacterium HGW-Deltaproteobacteria-1]|nr:MAG: hypothetical protein CVU51_10000 [Deltaproteobacteria bacterium HGW-Deltaproteobacteria-1]
MNKYSGLIVLMLLFVLIQSAPPACGADFLSQIHPYLNVKGQYSDNLNLTASNQKRDFYTTISPGIKFSNMSDRSGINLDASIGYLFYSDYSNLNYLTGQASLDAKYLTSSRFNFYLRNAFIRSDDPREREFFSTAEDNKYLLATETQRAVYLRNVVEPTVEYQFGPESRVGVKYRNNYYRAEDVENRDSIENYISPFLIVWLNKQHGFQLDYGYTNGHFEASPDLKGHRVSGAYMLRFTPKATASLKGAYTLQTFSEDLLNYQIYETSVGISYLFSETLTASAEAGYYWLEPEAGINRDGGVSFKADIIQTGERTRYRLSVQGGYVLDYFTSQNLGFRKFYRATGSITHFLDKRLSIGCLARIQRSEEESESDTGLRNTTWSAGANIAYTPFKWLTVSLEYTYNQNNTNYIYEATNEYKENRAMVMVSATY